MSRVFVAISGARQYAGDVCMARHREAAAGYWAVYLCVDAEASKFLGLQLSDARAVVDDFGNLVRVQ